MKPDTILQLAIRLLGLVFLYHGIQQLPGAVFQVCSSIPGGNFGGMFTGIVIAGWPLAAAFWLLRGAPIVMRIAHPELGTSSEIQAERRGTPDQAISA